MKILIVLIIMILVPTFLFPIGRTGNGNGIMDMHMGFEANLPSNFTFKGNLLEDKDSVALQSLAPIVRNVMGLPTVSQKLIVKPLEHEYPELIGLNPIEMEANLKGATKMNWQTLPTKGCLHSFISITQVINIGIVVWGPDKGIVLMGSHLTQIEQGIKEIIENIQLYEGACSWK